MFQQNRFGNDGTNTSRPGNPDNGHNDAEKIMIRSHHGSYQMLFLACLAIRHAHVQVRAAANHLSADLWEG
jgi:hypothetical protein